MMGRECIYYGGKEKEESQRDGYHGRVEDGKAEERDDLPTADVLIRQMVSCALSNKE